MKMPRKRNSRGWWFHRGITVAFFASIWLPLLGIFVDVDPTVAVDERRQLAKLPGADGTPFSREQIRDYFTDHVGLRDAMLRLHANVKLAIFKTSNHRIVKGDDGWYFCDFYRAVKASTGRIRLHQRQVERWHTVLSQRADYLEAKGIKYAFLMVPDKHYVHGNRLPEYLREPLGPSVLDQFVDQVALRNVHLIDIRSELLDAANQHETFYKGDTHWNGYGQEAGYRGILRGLRGILGPQDCLQPREVTVTEETITKSGDLYRELAIDDLVSDRATDCRIRDATARRVDVPADYYTLEPSYRRNDKMLHAYENPSCNGPRLVMFHTSFSMNQIRLLLAEHFSRVVFVRHSDGHRLAFHKMIIEQEQPDIVINEIPTRFLMINPLVSYNQNDWTDSMQAASLASKPRPSRKQ